MRGDIPGGAGSSRTNHEWSDYKALSGVGGHERDLVNPLRLSEPVDTAGTLLEPRGTPGQLVVDNDPAVVVEVQPFGRGVGREQGDAARVEGGLCPIAFGALEPAMKRRDLSAGRANQAFQAVQSVAIFSEHDDRLRHP